MTQQEKQKQTRLQLDKLIEGVEQIFTEHGLEIEEDNQTGSFVYFPKVKMPSKETQQVQKSKKRQ